MTAAALGALAAALLVWSPGSRLARLRLARLRPRAASADVADDPAPSRLRRWSLAGAAGLAVAALLGGLVGALAGTVVAVLAERALRGRDDRDVERAAIERELPAACDLLGVCLAAGVPVATALAAVGAAVPEPVGSSLAGVAALSRLGADPRRAWVDVPAELAVLGRVLIRAGESGAAAVPALRALAAESRAAARAAAQSGVQRAGVWVLAPLGLCFLPAFVCLGVVPMVLGIAGDVFR